jgi:hypothetical protein
MSSKERIIGVREFGIGGIWDLEFGVWNLGFGVWGLEFPKVQYYEYYLV